MKIKYLPDGGIWKLCCGLQIVFVKTLESWVVPSHSTTTNLNIMSKTQTAIIFWKYSPLPRPWYGTCWLLGMHAWIRVPSIAPTTSYMVIIL